MHLRIFALFFLFPFLSGSMVDASSLNENEARGFQVQKKTILIRMNEMLTESKNGKLDILQVGEDEEINKCIDQLVLIKTSDKDNNEEIHSFIENLFGEPKDNDEILSRDGQSAAKTYLQIKDTKIKRALKVYEVSEEEKDYLYELLSCLFVKEKLEEVTLKGICFANLENACFWQSADDKKKFVLVFEGAKGKDIESAIEGGQELDTLLPIARAFAKLHLGTQKATTEGPDYTESHALALSNIIDLFSKKMNLILLNQDKKPNVTHSKSLIHRDAHIGNIVYDAESGLVTFIDYETAFDHVIQGADPVRDIGCFMISVWTKIFLMHQDTASFEGNYEKLSLFRKKFSDAYLSVHKISQTADELLDHLKLHMWGYAGYMFMQEDEGGNPMKDKDDEFLYSFPTLKGLGDEALSFLLEKDLDEDWRTSQGLVKDTATGGTATVGIEDK